MTQYSKRMVIIHWLTLVLVITTWFLGEAAHDARHEKVATITAYAVHALAGSTVLLLTLTQLYFRRKDGTPPQLDDKPVYQAVARMVHYALYAVLILLPVSGVMQIITSDLGKALWTGNAAMLPKKFDGVFAHVVHEQLVNVLIALVLLHIIGAIKHQFIMKDGLMDRMSLRKKD